jgi:hypothetical protein
MLMTILATAGGFLKRVPWPIYAALAVLLASWAWGNHRYHQGEAAVEAKYARAAAQAVAQARKADAVGTETAQAGKDATEAGNAKAREAAAASDDPLKAAMDSLGAKR